MPQTPPTLRRLLPWLAWTPLLLLTGALVGRALQRSSPSQGTDPIAAHSEPRRITGSLPSLAPLIERTRPAVLQVSGFLPESRAGEEPVAEHSGPVLRHEVRDVSVVQGTAFVLARSQLIATCRHNVAGCEALRVRLPDGSYHKALLVAEDAVSDLALLRLEGQHEPMPGLRLAPANSVRQGDFVFGLGHPYGFRDSLSFGVVAHPERHLIDEALGISSPHLQFTAPLHPGKSGGPLLDMQGRVVGMTRRTLRDAPGISFATPVRMLQELLRSVRGGEPRRRRGYLGLEFGPLPPAQRAELGDCGVQIGRAHV